ncbi:MAG: hypothetical protein KKB20_05290 [Proteobacteria bacterium]|nr:hypothetical protein [Pseudomonadota bacterium]
MSDETYKIVFQGRIQDGFSIETVKAGFGRIFNLNAEKVETLFSGRPTVIRNNLDREQALKYKKAIENTGAECQVLKNEVQSEPAEPVEAPAEAPVKQAAAVIDPAKMKVLEKYRSQLTAPQCLLAPDIPEELISEAFGAWAKKAEDERPLAWFEIQRASDKPFGILLTDRHLHVRSLTRAVRSIPFEQLSQIRIQREKKQWEMEIGVSNLYHNIPEKNIEPIRRFLAMCFEINGLNPPEEVMAAAESNRPPEVVIRDEQTRLQALGSLRFDLEKLQQRLKQKLTQEDEAKKVLKELKTSVVRERPSAYVPSGKTSPKAVRLLRLGVPVAAVAGFVFWFLWSMLVFQAIMPLWVYVASKAGRWILFIGMIGLAIMYAAGFIAGGGWTVARTIQFFGRKGANRSPSAARKYALIAAILMAAPIFLFFLLDQRSGFWHSWLNWLLAVGVFAMAAIYVGVAGYFAEQAVEEDKFCEVKQVYLKKHRSGTFDLSELNALIDALRNGDHNALAGLKKGASSDENFFILHLFMLPGASRFAVGYLEALINVEVHYAGDSNKDGQESSRELWRFLSLAYDSKELVKIGRTLQLVE